MPSSETRMLIRMPFFAQNSTMRVSIGMARCGRQAGRVDADLPQRGGDAAGTSPPSPADRCRVVGSPPEMFRFSTAPQNGIVQDRLELRERHVRLAVAPLPVAAHRAVRVADPGAVVDEHRRADGVELRADEGIDEVARDARGRLREVLQPEGVGGHSAVTYHV